MINKILYLLMVPLMSLTVFIMTNMEVGCMNIGVIHIIAVGIIWAALLFTISEMENK